MNNDKGEHQRALARERQRRRRERLRKIEQDMKIQIDKLSHQIKLEEMSKNEKIFQNEINELQQQETISVSSMYVPECIYEVDKKLNEAEKKNHKLNIEKIERQRALARERQRRRRERLSEMERDVIKETDKLSHFIKMQKMNENERLVHREIKRLQQQKRREDIRAATYRLNAFLVPKILSEEEKNDEKINQEINSDKIERQRTLARERQRRRRERLKGIRRHVKRETEQILPSQIGRNEILDETEINQLQQQK